MNKKDLEHAAHALLTAASRFDAGGADDLEIELQHPILAIDLAIIANYQDADAELRAENSPLTIELPHFKCPARVVAIGRESGVLKTLTIDDDVGGLRLEGSDDAYEYWYLQDDRVVDHEHV